MVASHTISDAMQREIIIFDEFISINALTIPDSHDITLVNTHSISLALSLTSSEKVIVKPSLWSKECLRASVALSQVWVLLQYHGQ